MGDMYLLFSVNTYFFAQATRACCPNPAKGKGPAITNPHLGQTFDIVHEFH